MAVSSTKQQLMLFDKELIVDELHNLFNKLQISQFINKLQQIASTSMEISVTEEDDEIGELTNQSNTPQLPEPHKRKMSQASVSTLQTSINSHIRADKTEIIFQAWLNKKGKYSKNYKKRWFVLYHDNRLLCYEKPEYATNQKKSPVGEISLYNVTNIIKHSTEYKFELVSKDKTFMLRANNLQSYEQWLKKINARVYPNIVHKGWAVKKANSKRNWNRRFFALVHYEMFSELRYYEDERMTKFKKLIDVANISEVKLIDGKDSIKKYGRTKDKCLELITSSRTFVMSFTDVTKRNEWKERIMNQKFSDNYAINICNSSINSDDDDAKKEVLSEDESITLTPQHKYFKSIDESSDSLPKMDTVVSAGKEDVLPVGWIEYYDDNNRPYYYNEICGQTQWEKPVDNNDDNLSLDDNDDILPAGWSVFYNEDGVAYYHNEEHDVTQWDKPKTATMSKLKQQS